MRNELAFKSVNEAVEVMKVLLDNDYVCMLSYEENLTILNYEWYDNANRNGVVFMSREDYDTEMESAIKEYDDYINGNEVD